MPSPDFDKLERLIHQNLRALPGREAPPALETRVLAALARREALPWWRQSYARWPVGVRFAFILLLAAGAGAVFAFGRSLVTAQAFSQLAMRFPWLEFLQSIETSLREAAGVVFESIPTAWLYGAAVLLVVSYGVLFGLGAVIYRAFYRPRRIFRPLLP